MFEGVNYKEELEKFAVQIESSMASRRGRGTKPAPKGPSPSSSKVQFCVLHDLFPTQDLRRITGLLLCMNYNRVLCMLRGPAADSRGHLYLVQVLVRGPKYSSQRRFKALEEMQVGS